jgi:hypothetical protein
MSYMPACAFFARLNSADTSIPASTNTTLNMNRAIVGGSIAGRYVYASLDLILQTTGGFSSSFQIYLDRSPSTSQYARQVYPDGRSDLISDDSSWGDGTNLVAIAKGLSATSCTLVENNGILMGAFL